MPVGEVVWFDSRKGFGFIAGDEKGEDILVHYSQIVGEGYRNLHEGNRVEYEIGDGLKGKREAKNVKAIR